MRTALQALRTLRTDAVVASADVTSTNLGAALRNVEAAGQQASFLSRWARGVSSSAAPQAQARVAVEGDLEGVLQEIDRVVSSESAGAKEVADAAVALAYLQAKGNRRLWGKVFEKAGAVGPTFDAASLTSFAWAASTAGVGHFKTVFELSGAAGRVLPSLSPSQLSHVVEALGSAGAADAELFSKIAAQVAADVGSFKPADLARLLWGFGAAGVDNAKFVAAVSKALTEKASELGGREVAQAVWGLAKLKRADKATLDALVKAAKGKLDSGVDAAGLAWALGYLGYKPDAETAKGLSAALTAGVAHLTPAHAVDAAWGLGVMGVADKEVSTALFGLVSAALEAAPDALDPYQAAALFEAAAASSVKLPEQVVAYAAKMHALVAEGAKAKRSARLVAFKADLAEGVARSMGARYRPEVATAIQGFAATTADGVALDISVSLDAQNKVAVEAVANCGLTSAGTPLGPALSRAKLLEARGYKVVLVSQVEWAALDTPQAKAKAVLAKVRAAVPSASSKLSDLQKQLDAPFDPYTQ
mmetsp:Transcript_7149/g.12323  ORF Transcript_7149/g.12323 Transcript_7149/m.12323 type:complete len:533 (+) Transcript_7149:71-1669(+)|eukprot:CAMPEP_0119108604 /NCGR_PEP_ID=MMETSP1180-20130426/15383_1 /TAXON_ID=3052 ORGANISM="Chlamydomonas cf sp, Strain CCMP681" /NCGR_SAMPLE_ID=MMETSP1180 /ASSEMBLY_ACC=CAM_ASM_000741 /LENGTH=532 /DNA_ID=CAMNT_0007094235 /DNA_START=60 /DNA_END=1658 /DNA_ORIENTATION=+